MEIFLKTIPAFLTLRAELTNVKEGISWQILSSGPYPPHRFVSTDTCNIFFCVFEKER